MVEDLLIGIISSLVASIIVGFIGNKAISKQSSIILKIYVLFLSAVAFVVCAIINVVLNERFVERMNLISEVNLLRFYQSCINSFVLVLVIITFMTGAVIMDQAFDRSAKRDHKESMDRLKL